MTNYASTLYNFVGRRLSWSNGANTEQTTPSHDQNEAPSPTRRPLSLATAFSNLTTWDTFSPGSDTDGSDSTLEDTLSEQTLVTGIDPDALNSSSVNATTTVDNALIDNITPHTQFESLTSPIVESYQSPNSSGADSMKPSPLPEDDGQNALRKQLSDIHRMDIPEREKAMRMHALMTQKYNASQKQKELQSNGHENTSKMDDPLAITGSDAKRTYHKNNELGCAHYKRGVKLQCSYCAKWYTCRFCHDEQEDHSLIRRETKNMLCMHCGKAQPAQQDCRHCGVRSARYYCDKCKLWDDDPEKKIYHCDDCGICRIGAGLGKDFFHCKKCGVCMSITLQDFHRCIERSTECDCPICGEYMFTSTMTVVFMTCGHSIHHKCYYEHMKRSYRCPTCTRTIANMESQFRALDIEIAHQPLPQPYNGWRCLIACNDCSARSNVPFHFLGLKCDTCRSYNTSQLKLIRPEDSCSPSLNPLGSISSQQSAGSANIASPPNSSRIPVPEAVPEAVGGGTTSTVSNTLMAATAAIVSADAAIDMILESRRLGRNNPLLYDDGWGSAEEDSSDESGRGLSDGDNIGEYDIDWDDEEGLSEPAIAQVDVEEDEDDDDDDDDFLQLTGHR